MTLGIYVDDQNRETIFDESTRKINGSEVVLPTLPFCAATAITLRAYYPLL